MIGYHFAKKMVEFGHTVYGFDNFNDYYDPILKLDRKHILTKIGVEVHDEDLGDVDYYYHFYHGSPPDVLVHLAAYANPRHSLMHPQLYIDVNISGTQRLINHCEKLGINNVIYASSSCVMEGQSLPYKESDRASLLTNPYAWTKRANESQFSHAKIARNVGLRFFTVYGDFNRPDMALGLFADWISKEKQVTIYNHGNMRRDWTHIDDIVQGMTLVMNKMIVDEKRDSEKYAEIYNIGSGKSVLLLDFLSLVEKNFGKKATLNLQPMAEGDVVETLSDISKISTLGYSPTVSIEDGVERFVKWYRDYYKC